MESTLPLYAPINRWCELSGVGRRATYDLLATGKLQAIKRGRSTLIDVAHGIEYLRSLPAAKIRLSPQAARNLAKKAEAALPEGSAV